MNITEDRLWDLLKKWDIPTVPMRTASSPDEATEAARTIQYPLVMKILSRDISHKSDVGGIILDIKSEDEVRQAYRTLMDSIKKHAPDARVEGVILQEMAQPGLEVIIGAKLDPQFGHVIMFGLGGIFVEIYRDVSFRVTPVNRDMARDMIHEIKASSIIKGTRGQQPKDIDAVIDVITKLSGMLDSNPEIIELDINPLIVYSRGAVAVDARMLIH